MKHSRQALARIALALAVGCLLAEPALAQTLADLYSGRAEFKVQRASLPLVFPSFGS